MSQWPPQPQVDLPSERLRAQHRGRANPLAAPRPTLSGGPAKAPHPCERSVGQGRVGPATVRNPWTSQQLRGCCGPLPCAPATNAGSPQRGRGHLSNERPRPSRRPSTCLASFKLEEPRHHRGRGQQVTRAHPLGQGVPRTRLAGGPPRDQDRVPVACDAVPSGWRAGTIEAVVGDFAIVKFDGVSTRQHVPIKGVLESNNCDQSGRQFQLPTTTTSGLASRDPGRKATDVRCWPMPCRNRQGTRRSSRQALQTNA